MRAVVVGAGLAGCEAAYQLAKRGVEVTLYEMKPIRFSPAHHSEDFCELVCSNSLRSNSLANAVGLLKEELRRLGSLIMRCADKTALEAGGALAVDREGFAKEVTRIISSCENIEIERKEIVQLPEELPVIVATGPLTSEGLCTDLNRKLGGRQLYFYDAAAPIVTFESVDMERAFFASRYGKGTPDYINCPMTKEEYEGFYEALVTAQEAPIKEFEDLRVFEGCMPVEVMAKRGEKTLLFGPLKPVGITDPHTGREPYAVVQLRKDNKEGSLYNIVGFQTHLKFPEQKRVFSMIPALKKAEFMRYGVMHRNTFIDSPRLLDAAYRLHGGKDLYFAGQMTGVEGYVESAASGFTAGVNLAAKLLGKGEIIFPKETAIGGLAHYISDRSVENFQPMNINFGIISPLGMKVRGKVNKNNLLSGRALSVIDGIVLENDLWEGNADENHC